MRPILEIAASVVGPRKEGRELARAQPTQCLAGYGSEPRPTGFAAASIPARRLWCLLDLDDPESTEDFDDDEDLEDDDCPEDVISLLDAIRRSRIFA